MPIFGNRPPRTFPLLVVCALAATSAIGPRAWAQTDSTLDMAQRLLKRAYTAAHDAPLAQNADAGQVIAALRSSGDKDLLPFFQKMRQSKAVDNQIFGMVAAAILAKQARMDPEKNGANNFDTALLFTSKDAALVGSAIASPASAFNRSHVPTSLLRPDLNL